MTLEEKLIDMEAFMRECCHNLGAAEGADMYNELWHAVRDANRYRWLRDGEGVMQALGAAQVVGEALDRGCDRGRRAKNAAPMATMPAPVHDHSQGIAFCPHCSPMIGLQSEWLEIEYAINAGAIPKDRIAEACARQALIERELDLLSPAP